MRKLLVPLDGSELGEAVLPWVACLARQRDFTPVLARVVPWPTYAATGGLSGYVSAGLYEELIEGEQIEAGGYLEQIEAGLLEQGIKAETAIRVGAAGDGILDLADEVGAVAIVMATHGRGGLTRLVFGSVAEHVLQHATVPVLLVPARAAYQTATPELRQLLVPLDGSPLAERALDAARDLVEPNGRLLLVQAVEPTQRLIIDAEGSARVVDEEATRRATEQAAKYLARARDEFARSGYTLDSAVKEGEPGKVILEVARQEQADLIVLGTHGRTGPARWWLGSVADEVVRETDRPVLLVSARTAAARATGPYAVRDLMTRDLSIVRDDESLAAVLRKLMRRRVSGLPVVDAEDRLVGVISEYDLLVWQAKLVEAQSHEPTLDPADYGRRLEATSVRQVMSHPPLTIDEAAPIYEAIKLFRDRRLRRMPVTNEGALVGILTRADVLKAMAEQWRSTSATGEPE